MSRPGTGVAPNMTEGLRPAEGAPTASGPISARGSHWPILAFLALGVVVGLLFVRDYGISTDEPRNAEVGAKALQVYAGSREYFELDSLAEHGPFYFMLFSATSEALVRLIPRWLLADGRHFTNYLSFLAGVFCYYLICLRVVRPRAALLATVLFATQPLLFGSAFINQKDIPFMTLCLAVVALGLSAGDGQRPIDRGLSDPSGSVKAEIGGYWTNIKNQWQAVEPRRRRAFALGSVLGLLIVADLFLVGLLHHLGEAAVVAAFSGRAPWPIQQLFDRVATDAYKTPLSLYLERYETLFASLRLALSGLLAVAGTLVFDLGILRPRDTSANLQPMNRYPAMIGGAFLLGCAVSIRQIGLFVGGLVSLYVYQRGGRKAILPLLSYWTIAAVVTYATWPYLWPSPIQGILDSFFVIQDVGHHDVLFQGRLLDSFILPRSYLPTLLAAELTEPALVLGCLGLAVIVWRFLRGRTNRPVVGVLALWLIVPIGWQVSQHVPTYNNLRHFLFIMPPLLVLAGVGLEAFLSWIRSPRVRGLFVTLALIPGVWGIIWLHPYEYTYFNSLVGGTSGAYGDFDLDYWCTSLKEAAEAVNQVTHQDATVQIFGAVQNAAPYLRPDLRLLDRFGNPSEADVVALCMHRSARWRDRSGFRLVAEIRRGNAVFAQVWQQGDGRSPASAEP